VSATVAFQTAGHAEASARGPRIIDILPLPASPVSIFSNRLFLPGLLTALVACLLLYLHDNPPLYFRVIAGYIVLMIVTIFYQNSMLRNRLLSLVFAAAGVAAILWINQIFEIFIYVFVTLPGLTKPATLAFGERFTFFFVAAGLMEELIKAVPALVGLCIFLVASLLSRGRSADWLVQRFGVATPMQGLMMGIAAGGAFTLIETLELYVPDIQTATANDVARIIGEELIDTSAYPKIQESLAAVIDFAAQKTGLVSGFFLLLPRTLGALVCHMSYAGIFGYFIGLAGLYRGVWTVPLLIFGWLLAAAIHAAWNALSPSPTLQVMTGIMSFVIFFSYYFKALPKLPADRFASQQSA